MIYFSSIDLNKSKLKILLFIFMNKDFNIDRVIDKLLHLRNQRPGTNSSLLESE